LFIIIIFFYKDRKNEYEEYKKFLDKLIEPEILEARLVEEERMEKVDRC
jgi:hypothetical protein